VYKTFLVFSADQNVCSWELFFILFDILLIYRKYLVPLLLIQTHQQHLHHTNRLKNCLKVLFHSCLLCLFLIHPLFHIIPLWVFLISFSWSLDHLLHCC
jgi:hypothetical protein